MLDKKIVKEIWVVRERMYGNRPKKFIKNSIKKRLFINV